MLSRRIVAAALIWSLPFLVGEARSADWRYWHGDAGNTGFVDVVTTAALSPRTREAGPVAFGAGPVIGSDGTIYLANTSGLVRAFDPVTLGAKWKRQLREKILASPTIGQDGSIYVVGVRQVAETSGPGQPVRTVYESALYRLDGRTGDVLFRGQFPAGIGNDRGFTSATATLWRDGALELAMVPVNYGGLDGAYANHIVAFTMGGIAISNHKVADVPAREEPFDDHTDVQPPLQPIVWESFPKMPSLALFGAPEGRPQVIAADGYRNIVAYNFTPSGGFVEASRRQLFDAASRTHMSSPVMLRGDGHSLVRVGSFAYFGPPSPVSLSALRLIPDLSERDSITPTLLGDGRIAFLSAKRIAVARTFPAVELVVPFSRPLRTRTSVAAAASRTHLFVSTDKGLVSFSTRLMGLDAEFLWSNGGLSPPAVAGDGRVYAIANETLYAFPPPACRPPRCGTVGGPRGAASEAVVDR